MKSWIFIFTLFTFVATSFAAETKAEHDYAWISLFLQPSISFISFEHQDYFQKAIDTIYYDLRVLAQTKEESLSVAKQDFQKVNFCFPITGGLQFQFLQDQFISVGATFIYDKEAVVLTDRKNKTHNYDYTLQGFPLFLEYRFAIPSNLITLSGESLFSISLRWFWLLPGSEIYSSWGMLEAKRSLLGNGFGLSVGYLIASWKRLNIFGELSYNRIIAESRDYWSKIVPAGPDEKAKWDLGGISLQVRIGFGIWNKPKPIENTE